MDHPGALGGQDAGWIAPNGLGCNNSSGALWGWARQTGWSRWISCVRTQCLCVRSKLFFCWCSQRERRTIKTIEGGGGSRYAWNDQFSIIIARPIGDYQACWVFAGKLISAWAIFRTASPGLARCQWEYCFQIGGQNHKRNLVRWLGYPLVLHVLILRIFKNETEAQHSSLVQWTSYGGALRVIILWRGSHKSKPG